ncbi:MAG: hypothetical protein R2769_04325 [Saprospiraceae bacterium]
MTPEIEERLNFELQVIEKSGYPGYFLSYRISPRRPGK